jgi:hypothetical protein
MVGIESQEGQSSVCGAFVRFGWLASENAGRAGDNAGKNAGRTGDNAGENAGRNTSGNARARRWSLQAAPVVTPGRAARSGALAVSLLLCLCAGLASGNASRRPGLINAPERHLSDARAPRGEHSRGDPVRSPRALHRAACAALSRALIDSTEGATTRALARSAVKRGDCRDLSGSVWIRLNLPNVQARGDWAPWAP